jgi:nitroreductase
MSPTIAPALSDDAALLAAIAGRAPSLHNAQPWRLLVAGRTVDLRVDPARHLPVADPCRRQQHLGLGAALFALRLGLAGLHRDHTVEVLPDPADPDLVARLTVTGERSPTSVEMNLLAELDLRRTVRTPFTEHAVPVGLQVALTDHAAAEGAALRWVTGTGERRGVGALVAVAERQQQSDPAYLAELRAWTHPETVAAGAGVPPSAFGADAIAGHAAPFPLRDFAGGTRAGTDQSAEPLEPAPTVAALTTPTDRCADWITGGQALMRVLLAASAAGLASSQLNQPIELPALRQLLRDELGLPGWPQVLLRLGYPIGPTPPPMPRRPIADILIN